MTYEIPRTEHARDAATLREIAERWKECSVRMAGTTYCIDGLLLLAAAAIELDRNQEGI